MSLTVNRTEEKESNWADLIDGLRFDGFRRSLSGRGSKFELLEPGGTDDAARVGGAKRGACEPEPS
ncbi:MAG TPA: hypothetical protein VLX30_04495 [Burkholderiales bacterium]|nr:hypothetical protein [Burkholderiales bacterium]